MRQIFTQEQERSFSRLIPNERLRVAIQEKYVRYCLGRPYSFSLSSCKYILCSKCNLIIEGNVVINKHKELVNFYIEGQFYGKNNELVICSECIGKDTVVLRLV